MVIALYDACWVAGCCGTLVLDDPRSSRLVTVLHFYA